jgi:hypothetical protein
MRLFPARIKNNTYNRLLEKYVNAQGVVVYEKWKNNAEDMKSLEDYRAEFAPSGNATRGDERYASLVTFPWSLSHEFARLFHCKPIVNGNRSCHGVIQETRCFGWEHF